MGIFNRRKRREEAAFDALMDYHRERTERSTAELEAGTRLFAEAVAFEMFANGANRTQHQGVVECWGEDFQFRPDGALNSDEGWRISKRQIDQVRDGDEPGELMITFRPPSPFLAITVKPKMHEDKWRELTA